MIILREKPTVVGNDIFLVLKDEYVELMDFYKLKVNEINLLNSGYDISFSISKYELEKIEILLEIISEHDFNLKEFIGLQKVGNYAIKLEFKEISSGFQKG